MSDDLVAFLRARLDEDEQIARAADGNRAFDGTGTIPDLISTVAIHVARHDPARVLAEVDAKRRLIDSYLPEASKTDEQVNEEWGYGSALADDLLRLLALPYADHPDYRDDWRP